MHKFIEKYCEKIIPVGSRVTCNPAPTDTDQDYLVLCKFEDDFYRVMQALDSEYYIKGGSEIMSAEEELSVFGTFSSYKKGDVNYIVTMSSYFFDNFLHATNIAKKLNLLDKQQRIDLFQIILYENFGEHEFVESYA